MRRWTITLVLGGAALCAAALAPRLATVAPAPEPVAQQTPAPPVATPTPTAHPTPIAPPIEPIRTAPPPPPPAAPAPKLDDFWIDAVDCGMG